MGDLVSRCMGLLACLSDITADVRYVGAPALVTPAAGLAVVALQSALSAEAALIDLIASLQDGGDLFKWTVEFPGAEVEEADGEGALRTGQCGTEAAVELS